MSTPEEYLRIEDVVLELKRPVDTVRYWRKTGRGPRFVRIGRRLVCRRSDLDAWLEQQFTEAPTS